jgi:NodT family efflux transporter outer membrane factor (OMF) lipoprotein
MSAARLAAPLLVLCATACTTVGPDFQPPRTDAPARWQDWHGGDPALAQPSEPTPALLDWRQLEDPVLLSLMRRARQANLDVLTAAARLAQARAQRGQVQAQGGPRLDATAAATRQRLSERGTATRMADALPAASREALLDVLSAPHTVHQAGLDAAWELDFWGGVRRAVEAADARVEHAQALLAQAQLLVRSEVAREWATVRTTRRQRELLEAQVAAGEEVLALQQARVAGGLDNEMALATQREALARLRARGPQLLQQEAAAVNRLSMLLGERPGALQSELAAAPGTPPWPARAAAQPGLPSTLALRRPDIQAAQQRLRAATANIGVAVADLYPRVMLTGSLGAEALSGDDLLSWGARQWRVGPSLSIPLFDGARRRATVTLRELQQQEAAVAFQQTVLAAWHEVDDALSAYNASQQHLAQAAARAAAASEREALAQHRSRGGLTAELPLLQARQARLDAQQQEADASGQAAAAWIVLSKALAVPEAP